MSKKLLVALAVVAACTTAVTPIAAQEALRLGTSGSGSVFYTLGVGLSRLISEHAGINVSVESVGGSHANVFAMMNDQVDLAIVNAQAAGDGYDGSASPRCGRCWCAMAPASRLLPIWLARPGSPPCRPIQIFP